MSNASDNWTKSESLYDGHLEKPLHAMTIEERFRWIDEGARMLQWARQVRIDSGLERDVDLPGDVAKQTPNNAD